MNEEEVKLLNELLDHDPDDDGRRLSDWEVGFVESLNGWRAERLSPKQSETLRGIHDRIFR